VAGGNRECGFGLVEILVAMAIGLFLLAGVIQVLVSSKQSYRTNEALARVQESGRIALDFIARDIRLAGFSPVLEGCGSPVNLALESSSYPPYPSGANDAGDLENGRVRVAVKCFTAGALDPDIEGCEGSDQWLASLSGVTDAIQGYEASGGSWLPSLPSGVSAVAGTDAFTIRGTSLSGGANGAIRIVGQPSVNLANFTVEDESEELAEDDIIMVVNESCDVGAVFQISAINSNSGQRTLVHNTGNGQNPPGNWTNSTGNVDFSGGFLFSLSGNTENTYFIDTATVNGEPRELPSLFRSSDGELVYGVEDMQLLELIRCRCRFLLRRPRRFGLVEGQVEIVVTEFGQRIILGPGRCLCLRLRCLTAGHIVE